eukprot:TRINITY_DN4500_c0_g1_i1.p1 TRINITY_DN4500_c0_g1~~TRINITY_DN4500_c0_g1_i1.p1  ORF type:complete len:103 (+),score=8.52 TRINITY_DN4500_c0_g1_i1:67-375(+)
MSTKNIESDPRRPNEERVFAILPSTQDEPPTDYMALLSLVLGLMGLMLKYRIFVLQSLVCCVISLANMKYAEMDVKQLLSAMVLVVMGLIMAYVGPQAKFFK